MMASEDLKFELFKSEFNELKQIKMDFEHLKNELSVAQTKYHQRLADYEAKFDQLQCQAEKIQQEQTEKEANLLNATAEWQEMKTKLESSVKSPNERVKLNVGGKDFETTVETLTKHSEGKTTYFKTFFAGEWQSAKDPKDGSIFIDRNGDCFAAILNYLRTDHLNIDQTDLTFRRNLIIEAEYYKMESLLSLLKMNDTKSPNRHPEQQEFYLETKVLSSEQQKELNRLYGSNNQRWRLIYRASRDGFKANHFHKRCDGCGPTMTVIQSPKGFIFGGFTSVPWSSSCKDESDANAFLFTLKNPHGLKPTRYSIREQAIQFAVSHRNTNGPTFGSVYNGGSDIHLQDPFNNFGNRIFFPRTYKDMTGKQKLTFTDNPHFSCEDVEVFLLVSE